MNWPETQITPRQTNIKWALKLLFVGDEGVGKTDLMCRVSDGVYIDGFSSKLGSSFGAKRVDMDPVRVQLQIWNVADSPKFEKLRPQFYRGGAGAVYVFSLTDRASFDNIPKWVEEVHKVLGVIPAILVGNRRDARQRRLVSKQEAKQLAKHLGIPYIEMGADPVPLLESALHHMVLDILKYA